MQHRLAFVLLFLFAIACPCEICVAFDQQDIVMHGFASQGYLKSSENNFCGKTEDGTYEFNEIGVNFAAPVTDELRFGVQFLSRDLGDYGNNELNIDWAMLAYERKSWLKLMAGKLKVPTGFYGVKWDGDMLRTSALMPQGVYPEKIRQFATAFYGVEAYGNIDLSSGGDLDYAILMGGIDLKKDSPFMLGAMDLIGMILNNQNPALGEYVRNGMDLSDLDIAVPSYNGGQLIWNLPITGLRVGGTYFFGEGDLSLGQISCNFIFDPVYVFSAEYETGPLLFASEYLKIDNKIKIKGMSDILFGMEGWYGSLSWRVKRWAEMAVSYSEHYSLPDDKEGDLFVAEGKKDYYAWQKDTAFSLRVDITDNWTAKVEAHLMNGIALCDITSDPEETDENWVLYAIKTSISF